MPFASDFDDVYSVIKSTVESANRDVESRCFRLDESRPAGRITDRLLSELRSATICVADLTGTKPNVMWEVGFAMALSKPTVLITQDLSQLPFDLKDMQSLQYDRHHLSTSLSQPLKRSIIDTLDSILQETRLGTSTKNSGVDLVGTMMAELTELKSMVSSVVNSWSANKSEVVSTEDLRSLEGNWVTQDDNSHVYSRIIDGTLIAPYCYSGNYELTGVYYGWCPMGEYWFGRYHWFGSEIAGFSFLRRESIDVLSGAWWSSEDEVLGAVKPPKTAGVPSTWIRQPTTNAPNWATTCLSEIEQLGLSTYLKKHGWDSPRIGAR
jgi:hypothetical protein